MSARVPFAAYASCPPRPVLHADLERSSAASEYRSVCPTCNEGRLFVARDQVTLRLLREDRCTFCGQRVIYQDAIIGGEALPALDVCDCLAAGESCEKCSPTPAVHQAVYDPEAVVPLTPERARALGDEGGEWLKKFKERPYTANDRSRDVEIVARELGLEVEVRVLLKAVTGKTVGGRPSLTPAAKVALERLKTWHEAGSPS